MRMIDAFAMNRGARPRYHTPTPTITGSMFVKWFGLMMIGPVRGIFSRSISVNFVSTPVRGNAMAAKSQKIVG